MRSAFRAGVSTPEEFSEAAKGKRVPSNQWEPEWPDFGRLPRADDRKTSGPRSGDSRILVRSILHVGCKRPDPPAARLRSRLATNFSPQGGFVGGDAMPIYSNTDSWSTDCTIPSS